MCAGHAHVVLLLRAKTDCYASYTARYSRHPIEVADEGTDAVFRYHQQAARQAFGETVDVVAIVADEDHDHIPVILVNGEGTAHLADRSDAAHMP